ncbi:MAG: universal stress protein, partial [Anaerolineae bacterium]
GPAAAAIVRVAAEQGCDLIIMGRRGLSPMEQILLGSVSDNVLHLTDVPILITHATAEEQVRI